MNFDLLRELLQKRPRRCAIGSVLFALLALYISGLVRQSSYSLSGRKMTFAIFNNLLYGLGNPVFTLALLAAFLYLLYRIGIALWLTEDDPELRYTLAETHDQGSAREMTDEEAKDYYDVVTTDEASNVIYGWANRRKREVYTYSFDKVLPVPNQHMAICAATGRGKTTNGTYNIILQCIRRGESFVVTDTSGETPTNFMNYCKECGYETRILNLIDPKHSDAVNFMSLFDLVDTSDLVGKAQQVAQLIISNVAPGRETEFFVSESYDILTWVMVYLAYSADRKVVSDDANQINLVACRDFLAQGAKQIREQVKMMPPKHPAYSAARTFVNSDEKAQDRVVRGALTMLQTLLDENLAQAVSHSDIDLLLPGKKKCAYFVTVSSQEHSRYWIAALFYGCMFIALADIYAATKPNQQLDVPVNMIFDEFPNIFKIPDFSSKLNTVRKNRISCTLIYQGIPEMELAYPHGEHRKIIGACDMQILMGTNDMETCKWFQELTGEASIETSDISYKEALGVESMTSTVRRSTGKRYARTPDEIRRLGLGRPDGTLPHELIFPKGTFFKEIEMFFWKEHPDYPKVMRAGITKIAEHVPLWKERGGVRMPATILAGGGEEEGYNMPPIPKGGALLQGEELPGSEGGSKKRSHGSVAKGF